jgi:hypothetical protein
MFHSLKRMTSLVVAIAFILASCNDDGKAANSKEEIEITQMDSTKKVVKENREKLEEQTEKVEESLEKLENEFDSTH